MKGPSTALKGAAARSSTQDVGDDQPIFFLMLAVINMTAQPFSRLFERDFDINLNEWRVLRIVANHPGISQNGVAQLIGLDKMTVSRAVGRLHKLSRVTKERSETNRREAELKLTSEGRRLYKLISATGEKRRARLERGFSDDELDTLRGYLQRFRSNALDVLEADAKEQAKEQAAGHRRAKSEAE
ncbi:MAG: MarR family transcriptional regulator [Pseudomonadota bacterium]